MSSAGIIHIGGLDPDAAALLNCERSLAKTTYHTELNTNAATVAPATAR